MAHLHCDTLGGADGTLKSSARKARRAEGETRELLARNYNATVAAREGELASAAAARAAADEAPAAREQRMHTSVYLGLASLN